MKHKRLVIADPYPQKLERIFSEANKRHLVDLVDLKESTDGKMPDDELYSYLGEAVAIIGQTSMPKERIDKSPNLRAIFNVEGNFYQNIDYQTCFSRNIYVLNCGGAYAKPVAEMALCFAIDLARGVTREDRRFRNGNERYVLEGNKDAVMLSGSTVGLIGFGLLGRSLRQLLDPFRCRVLAYDPWLPDTLLIEHGCIPVTLEELLSASRFIFVLAGVTSENQGFIGSKEFDLIKPGSNFILVSRAAVVDFDEFVERVATGQFNGATDVFPSEPMPKDHPIRQVDNMLLSPHRAGGIPQAFYQIGEMVLDDLKLILDGLSPVRMQQARLETVGRFRSRPVAKHEKEK
jgi:phosphoglycerate dehydrogenase-like enzyme